MRNKLLMAAAAAFVLSTVAAVAGAAPSPDQMRKAGEVKSPAGADAAITKVEAKDAKKQAHRAHRKAKVAHHKARVAAKKADQAEKASEKHG